MKIFEMESEHVQIAGLLFSEMWPHSSLSEETEYCKSILKDPNKCCYLAKTSDDYIGFAYAALRSDFVEGAKGYPIPYLEGIYVRKESRKTGVGQKLVETIEKWAKGLGYSQLASDVEFENKKSLHFHSRLGFAEENRIVCLIKNI